MTPFTRSARTIPTLLAAAGAAALCLTGPAVAHADPEPLNGTYTAQSAGQTGTWSVRSPCARQGCRANINSSSGWNGVAELTDGSWHMTVHNPRGFTCTIYGKKDGGTLPATMVYSIDATTLTGTVGYQDDGQCDTEPGWREEAITLTRAGD